MLLDILKTIATLAAAALLNYLITRRGNRLQKIPLIERVNRVVDPNLKGFTLARQIGEGTNRHIEEIANVREYVMTIRNTSSIHMKEVEVQFEFPTEDVEGWASRPAISRTALISKSALASEPWKKAFRWQIPYLPCADSVEFSFNAIDPPSDGYEVALYNSERVVVEVSKGEPSGKSWHERTSSLLAVMILGAMASVAVGLASELWGRDNGKKSYVMDGDGCIFLFSSYSLRASGKDRPFGLGDSDNVSVR